MDSISWSVLWGVGGSIIGALAVVIYRDIKDMTLARKGDLTGKWEQIIPAQSGEPEKLDIVDCKHIGNKLKGCIVRVSPADQSEKHWNFEAKITHDVVYGTYWPLNPSKNPRSYGTIQLDVIDVNQLKGYYGRLRTHTNSGHEGVQRYIKITMVSWVKANTTK